MTSKSFEVSKLIFVLPAAKWYPPSACLWTADTRISRKATIADEYAGLEDFFVKYLGVKKPSVDTYIEELELLISNHDAPSITRARNLIKKIGSWRPQQPALKVLHRLKFLPVRGLDGVVTLNCVMDNFAIVDRKNYGDALRGTIPALDFSIEEVHELQGICALSASVR